MEYVIGMVGLGVMGQNLALNMEGHGFSVVAYDIDPEKQELAKNRFAGKQIRVVHTMDDFIRSLNTPKIIWMMVPAGQPVDELIRTLKPHLRNGDILIDGGNSFFMDTQRRYQALKKDSILFIGTGVSGGEEGALLGPSLMPGGDERAWEVMKPVFEAIAAKTDDGAVCADWMGEGGAGHFVKMIHNGIEYADMQMIAEAYFLMERLLRLSARQMSTIFAEWNKGELESYLIEITARILAQTDPQTGKPMTEVILDVAGQKGTGRWTSQTALELGAPAQTIAEAVFARAMSALKEERVTAAKILEGPGLSGDGSNNLSVGDIRQALYASKICSYAQGFQLMRFANQQYGWQLDFAGIAMIWRAGCIIRAKFLNRINRAFKKNPDLNNLLLDDYFRETIAGNQAAWRDVVSSAFKFGIPVPAFSSALTYYDSYRSDRLPANLLQAQRDYFGAHTYERVDRPRGQFFHTHWD